MATVAHLYQGAVPINTGNRPSHQRTGSADDTQVSRASEQAKRYRRRSMTGIESGDASGGAVTTNTSSGTAWRSPSPSGQNMQASKPATSANRPVSHHPHASSADARPSGAAARPASSRQSSSGSIAQQAMTASKPELRMVNIPARGSSEASKRPTAPSPLSRPVADTETERAQPTLSRPRTEGISEVAPSPAAQHLAAVNDKDMKEGMKSRLRRAFSFGSAAELRKASAENSFSAERARLRKEKYQHEREAEQEAIAAKQEAGGIGAGIYSGQGNFFGGSTDNLSIQSTASSASIMLRKMGKGMKKSTRSLKGLFRPKSVIGVPAADGPVTRPSAAEVSIITVEAEREKVNVNIDPHDQAGGGTGFPKLERNSLDANSVASREVPGLSTGPPSDTWSRKSIVGGERERAEVLAAVKKGILKRSATSSGSSSPVVRPADNSLPTTQIIDTPNSSSPATPVDDQPAPLTQDYFVGAQRFAATSSRSLPNTPQGGPRNISFSSKIQFHDAWSATEYDRRGDIATCNRLTPMLAQQIKEELNSFKMEMEVHELSKPHTHFF
ncbi:bud neck involved protein [Coniosporium apollinis]|uniref:Bud neck involved protein n=1 Tax=Coniosporium apollinis TaxID=61459 RepID=A0ABQ9NXR1_9PEZI|nr:bud neck involved protein [Coniosporium apollinis]